MLLQLLSGPKKSSEGKQKVANKCQRRAQTLAITLVRRNGELQLPMTLQARESRAQTRRLTSYLPRMLTQTCSTKFASRHESQVTRSTQRL